MGNQGDILSWDRQRGDADVLLDWLFCDPQMLPVLNRTHCTQW